MLQTMYERVDPDVRNLPDWVWDLFVMPQFGVVPEGQSVIPVGMTRGKKVAWPVLLPLGTKTRIVQILAPFYDMAVAKRMWAFMGCPLLPPVSSVSKHIYTRKMGHASPIVPVTGAELKVAPPQALDHAIQDLEETLELTRSKINQILDLAEQAADVVKRRGESDPRS